MNKVTIDFKKRILIGVLLLTIIISMKVLGVFDYLSIDNAEKIKNYIHELGILGPIIYIVFFVIGCVVFIPAPPMAIIAGMAFGPINGSIYTCIGALISDASAFLIARYLAKDFVQNRVKTNKSLRKIDNLVKNHGWRILIITRLVPGFPYMLQSYAYGITNIKFKSYILLSWVLTMPGIIAFALVGGSINSCENMDKIFVCLGGCAILITILSLVPKILKKKYDLI
ncbi:MAG: TVP38/TMEM64 family protein [Tepidibacter sp.]|uniref:TVP38/TMEM64 family protein n=1 Tax=Tepidibacter sp. TaxID=2529387 RepID=UPI0025D808D9|nr:TVP38/TMEM64 family protein [Tepidibacter sp.]MCT4509651.1 TVP38/TMEM64 family protein [Tepidibacter sp.]